MCGGHVKTPSVQKVDPAVTNVTGNDISDTSGDQEAIAKKRKQRGYSSTQLSTLISTALNNPTSGKTTLG